MRRAIFLTFAALAPLPALADEFQCRTAGYCTNSLECSPDNAVLLVSTDKSGGASFGWETAETRFSAQGARVEGLTIYHTVANGYSSQTLVMADTLEATFSISGLIGGRLYTSFQALTCVRQ